MEDPSGTTFDIFGEKCSVCADCDRAVFGDVELCNECSESESTVPVSELEELVKAFRIGGEMSDVPLPSGREKGRSETFEICADELSELIDKHTNE